MAFLQEIYQAARYVATVTLSSLAELFSSARLIMEWLADCSSLVAKQGQPMSWVTPLGLPVIQPYRRESGHQVCAQGHPLASLHLLWCRQGGRQGLD